MSFSSHKPKPTKTSSPNLFNSPVNLRYCDNERYKGRFVVTYFSSFSCLTVLARRFWCINRFYYELFLLCARARDIDVKKNCFFGSFLQKKEQPTTNRRAEAVIKNSKYVEDEERLNLEALDESALKHVGLVGGWWA
ncbi:MAG: hypothetical protein E3J73_01135 [Candidatus Bathyarchaeum sp.]|nr:MAG: hypothetical protein E3J73_01135 [Candidatus Bathyarchaeum sp.]